MHINFAKWKLIDKNDKHATLKHSSGHTMTLAIKSLHPGNQAELAKLPLHKESKAKEEKPKATESSPVKKYADGGEVSADEGLKLDLANATKLPDTLSPDLINSNPGQSSGITQDATHTDPSFILPPQQQSVQPSTTPTPVATATTPAISQPTPMDQTTGLAQPQDMANQVQEATGMQLGGIGQEATAQGALGKQQAAVYQQQAKAQQDIVNHIQQVTQQHNDEISAVVNDIKNNHIDPSHYMSSLGTEQRISTGIGLILGGIGSAVAGGQNPALEFLNKQIDRDIEAQKAEMGKKENLVSLYSKMLGNDREGSIMASNVMAHITADKLNAAAAKSQDPLAQARAQQAAGALIAARAPEMQKLNMTQALINSSKTGQNDPSQLIGYMRAVNPEAAKEMESRYIPGVGMAQVPVPADARNIITAKQNLGQMAKDLYSWSQAHSGSLSPSDIATGATKAAELQSAYRNSINGGVFKKGEQEFIDQIVDSDPTKFFNSIRVLPKLKEVIDSNQHQLDTTKKAYGLPSSPAPTPEAAAKTSSSSHRDAPQGTIMNTGGVPHIKIDGGWKPVK